MACVGAGCNDLTAVEENKEAGYLISVTYDANGGENAPIEKIANHGERVNVTDFVPVKGNKTFLGWSTSFWHFYFKFST